MARLGRRHSCRERRLHLPPADPRESAPLPLDPACCSAAGMNVAARSIWRGLAAGSATPGSVEAICRAVIEDCWTGEFFAGSAGHFKQFWTRDLAMCTPALCRLGYRERVIRRGSGARALRARRAHRDDHLLPAASRATSTPTRCDSLPLTAVRAARGGRRPPDRSPPRAVRARGRALPRRPSSTPSWAWRAPTAISRGRATA